MIATAENAYIPRLQAMERTQPQKAAAMGMHGFAMAVPVLFGGDEVFQAAVVASVSEAHTIPVLCNQGRWLVRCVCNSAQIVSHSTPRFYCVECRNAWAGGAWVTTVWPENREEIEAVLMRRPEPHTRSWTPGETVADLEAQNAAHGVV